VKPVAQSQDTKGEVKTVAKKDDKAAGKVNLKPITITKKLDKASP
jgi:type VI protein secretion system component Hcp